MNVPNTQNQIGKYKHHKKVHQFIPGLGQSKHTVSLELFAMVRKYSKNERIYQKKETESLPRKFPTDQIRNDSSVKINNDDNALLLNGTE